MLATFFGVNDVLSPILHTTNTLSRTAIAVGELLR